MNTRGRHGIPFFCNIFRILAKPGDSSWKTWVRPAPVLPSTGNVIISTFAPPHSSNLQHKQHQITCTKKPLLWINLQHFHINYYVFFIFSSFPVAFFVPLILSFTKKLPHPVSITTYQLVCANILVRFEEIISNILNYFEMSRVKIN